MKSLRKSKEYTKLLQIINILIPSLVRDRIKEGVKNFADAQGEVTIRIEADGGSFSGDASVRLMVGGDVAPINVDLLANYANVFAGLKNKPHNSLNGVPYGVPHGRGANVLMWNTDVVTSAPTSWDPVWEGGAAYKGKISVYDSSIYIADAALHLMATQPDLGIKNPYQLNETQFAPAIALLEKLGAKNNHKCVSC